ncbi:Protein CBG10285 [Caenorhabditis briggsae]|uniref:Protein CBG10285 n=1 Tax=Caenorhabditis briggsae TaxID=6238 RepID=A8XAP5_CAEBR|nr:Protein CBG10285 [Caenorhabditis briggsae]CAP29710.1 Protein CBG10285 [Caenorhabditis briggsae]
MPRTPFRLFSPIQFGPGPQDEESEETSSPDITRESEDTLEDPYTIDDIDYDDDESGSDLSSTLKSVSDEVLVFVAGACLERMSDSGFGRMLSSQDEGFRKQAWKLWKNDLTTFSIHEVCNGCGKEVDGSCCSEVIRYVRTGGFSQLIDIVKQHLESILSIRERLRDGTERTHNLLGSYIGRLWKSEYGNRLKLSLLGSVDGVNLNGNTRQKSLMLPGDHLYKERWSGGSAQRMRVHEPAHKERGEMSDDYFWEQRNESSERVGLRREFSEEDDDSEQAESPSRKNRLSSSHNLWNPSDFIQNTCFDRVTGELLSRKQCLAAPLVGFDLDDGRKEDDEILLPGGKRVMISKLIDPTACTNWVGSTAVSKAVVSVLKLIQARDPYFLIYSSPESSRSTDYPPIDDDFFRIFANVLKAGFKIVESSSSLISLASSIRRTTRNYIDKQRKSATSIDLSKMLSDFMEKFKIDSEFRLSEPSIENCGTITKNLWTIRTPSTEESKKLKSVSPILSEEGLQTVDDSQPSTSSTPISGKKRIHQNHSEYGRIIGRRIITKPVHSSSEGLAKFTRFSKKGKLEK